MSFLCPESLVDARTVAAIVAARPHRPSTPDDPYACGCAKYPDKWYLCDYHEGYDAALEVHAQ